MAAKKKATRTSNRTLADFKKDLDEGKYNSVVGARRSVSYIPEKDREKGLKLVAEKFGVGLDEPGEATRGSRRGKRAKPAKVAKKVAKKAAGRTAKAKPAKKAARKAKSDDDSAGAPVPAAKPPAGRKRSVGTGIGTVARSVLPEDKLMAELGLVGGVVGTIDQAIRTMEKANEMSGGKLNIQLGLQSAADTLGEAVSSLSRYVPKRQPETAPTAPSEPVVEGERPTNNAAAIAAATAAGIPIPPELQGEQQSTALS